MTGKEPYDKIWTALKLFSEDCKAAQIPDTELPPAIADFLAMMIIKDYQEDFQLVQRFLNYTFVTSTIF